MNLDFDNLNSDIGATFVVLHLASGTAMGLGPMNPTLADKVARAWRGNKKVVPMTN